MRSTRVPVALLLSAVLVAGCASEVPSATPTATAVASETPAAVTASPVSSGAPAPTAVPGGETVSPGAVATRFPTTQTSWGEILDGLPDDFPTYPGAEPAEPPAEPVSGAFLAPAGVDEVAHWYRDRLDALGLATIDLSGPLEDGSRVLDSQGDLPECQVQSTFRPAGESTMITVLYGAACAGVRG